MRVGTLLFPDGVGMGPCLIEGQIGEGKGLARIGDALLQGITFVQFEGKLAVHGLAAFKVLGTAQRQSCVGRIVAVIEDHGAGGNQAAVLQYRNDGGDGGVQIALMIVGDLYRQTVLSLIVGHSACGGRGDDLLDQIIAALRLIEGTDVEGKDAVEIVLLFLGD